MEELIKKLLDNKASQSNSIDLDAYAQGLSDMATELLEQRNELLEAAIELSNYLTENKSGLNMLDGRALDRLTALKSRIKKVNKIQP